MGTRGMTAVFYKGEYRIAQYGQWDHYPEGQGKIALEFVRDTMDRERFQEKLLKLRDMTPEDGERIDKVKDWPRAYPQLSRDAGAKILTMVQDGEDGMIIKRNVAFAGDSVFCEWAWVIDLDKNTFEAFKGFNHDKLDASERFAGQPLDNPEYQPVKFVKAWPLDALPSDDEFVAALTPADEDEEAA